MKFSLYGIWIYNSINNWHPFWPDDLDAAYLEAYIHGMVGVMHAKLFLDSKRAEVYNFLILEMNNKKA